VRDHWIRRVIKSVTLAPGSLAITLDRDTIDACRAHEWGTGVENKNAYRCNYTPEIEERSKHVVLTLRIEIKKIDGKRLLLSPDGQDLILPDRPAPEPHMVEAIGRAYRVHEKLLKSRQPPSVLACELNINSTLLYKALSLTHLSPQILRRALTGTLPPRTTMRDLYRAAESLD